MRVIRANGAAIIDIIVVVEITIIDIARIIIVVARRPKPEKKQKTNTLVLQCMTVLQLTGNLKQFRIKNNPKTVCFHYSLLIVNRILILE